ncbi:MAG: hypothetical protein D6788_03310 [Planctomycetota bacterium]|nr:MAG: hypothetical protein D6788_03310 [Planctomycetota bacterium]
MIVVSAFLFVQIGFAQESQSSSEADLIRAGRVALREARPLRPGETVESDFKVMFGPDDVVGAAVVILRRSKNPSPVSYTYENRAALRAPNGERRLARVYAVLGEHFRPVRVEVHRRQLRADGSEGAVIQRAVVTEKGVEVVEETGGEKTKTEAPPLPDPTVYGLETIVQLVDFRKHPSYALHEFDVSTGKTRRLHVSLDAWRDGTPTILTMLPEGMGSYQFWFDEKGRLLRWAERSMPLMFVRTSREEARALLDEITGK